MTARLAQVTLTALALVASFCTAARADEHVDAERPAVTDAAAIAQTATQRNAPSAGPDTAPTAATGWAAGAWRPFAAARLDVGGLVRATAVLGYGQPHWMWVGVEASALATLDFSAAYVGLRASFVVVDASVAWRTNRSFSHVFPSARDAYSLGDIRRDAGADGPLAHYDAIDASLGGVVPIPYVAAVWEAALVHTIGVAQRAQVYEEYLRAVIRAPLAGVGRLALFARLAKDALWLGVLNEAVFPGDRGAFFRVGPALVWTISAHLDLAFTYTLPVASTDSLGVWDAAWGTVRLRWSLATGDHRAVLP